MIGATGDLATTLALGETASSVFRQALDSLPVAVYMTDADGTFTYFNQAAVRIMGVVPETGKDKWFFAWNVFRPDGTPLPRDQHPMAVTLATGSAPPTTEYIVERLDGTRIWLLVYPAVLRDAEGTITGGINVLTDVTEHKAREIGEYEPFRSIVDTTPECVKTVAEDGTLISMNLAGLKMIDAPTAEAVIGKNVYNIVAPEDRERFKQFNEEVCGGVRGSIQFDVVGLTGKRRHLESHSAPFRRFDGTTVQLAVTRDVTHRVEAERTSLLLAAIVDSSHDAIISKDLNGIIMTWNSGAERLFGYTAEEAVGRPVTMLMPPDRIAEESGILERLRRGERVDHFETVRQRKDGQQLDLSLTISPVKNSQGVIVGASKIARDISERKRAEAALVASEKRFRMLADSMPQMVWTALPDGLVDYVNERWYQFTGFNHDVPNSREWYRVVHPDDRNRSLEIWQESLRNGNPYDMEFRFWDRRESCWRWFVGRAISVRDDHGKIIKWFGSCTDIDEQKRVQDDLRRANQDLEQFAFSASHDLQEPLRSVSIYSELLGRRYGSHLNGEALQFINYMQVGAKRMEMLVRDLLAYTRLTRFEKREATADANVALEHTLETLAGVIAESGAQIQADSLPETVPVHEAHLQLLFQNLIGNALKYRSVECIPTVHITAEYQTSQWLFSVIDNGIGIDPAYKEKIFGLFKRLHTNDKYPGTGLGLAICQRIVDRYHGRIWVDSEPGKGSAFRFTIPV